MRPRLDLVGNTYGRLTVLSLNHAGAQNESWWNCICECGTLKVIAGYRLRNGNTRSCGCLRTELRKRGLYNVTHGQARNGHRSPTYVSWYNMVQRCTNSNQLAWRYYGGNTPPVKVCKSWQGNRGFAHFLADKGPRPRGTSLSRLGDVGNYTPSNTAWHTRAQQLAERAKKKQVCSGEGHRGSETHGGIAQAAAEISKVAMAA